MPIIRLRKVQTYLFKMNSYDRQEYRTGHTVLGLE